MDNTKLTYPRVMMVSDEPITENNPGEKRVVWAYNPRLYYAYRCYSSDIQSLEDLNNLLPVTPNEKRDGPWGGPGGCVGWGFIYAQDYIEPITIELTLEDIAKKFNINVTQLKIKK